MYNKVILVGNLSRDVELKYTPNGTAVAQFGIATNRTYKDTNTGESKQEVMFIDVKVFGKIAETANQYLHKGSKALVEGRLVLDQWVDKNGYKKSKHSIVAEKVVFMDTKSNNNQTNQARNQGNYAANTTNQTNTHQPPAMDIDEGDIPF